MARQITPTGSRPGRPYDRAELVSDAVIHLTGLGLAVLSVPVLITLAAVWRGDLAGVVGVSVYGVTLIVMLSASLAYNHVYRADLSEMLRKLDMSAIY
ncbi:MAG: Hly-III family protein, partial [Pseudomonadota bacterium]